MQDQNSLLGFPKAFREPTGWQRFNPKPIQGFTLSKFQGFWKKGVDSVQVQLYFQASAASGDEVRIPLPENYKTPPLNNTNDYLSSAGFRNTRKVGSISYPSSNGNELALVIEPNKNYATVILLSSTFISANLLGTNFGAGEFTLWADIPVYST